MTPEIPDIPDWARRERQADFVWMRMNCIRAENLDVFWTAATVVFEGAGRGAVVVDTTLEPIPGAGNPFGAGCLLSAFSQEQLKDQAGEDTKRVAAKYDPTQEFVLLHGSPLSSHPSLPSFARTRNPAGLRTTTP